jgi:hypothetical protein
MKKKKQQAITADDNPAFQQGQPAPTFIDYSQVPVKEQVIYPPNIQVAVPYEYDTTTDKKIRRRPIATGAGSVNFVLADKDEIEETFYTVEEDCILLQYQVGMQFLFGTLGTDYMQGFIMQVFSGNTQIMQITVPCRDAASQVGNPNIVLYKGDVVSFQFSLRYFGGKHHFLAQILLQPFR